MKASELVEKLISEYQQQADEMTAIAKGCCGDDATVSRYKWMHSLATAYKKMVADLDTVVAQLETPQLPDTREKLFDLMMRDPCPYPVHCSAGCDYYKSHHCHAERYADHLIANGVTFVTDNHDGRKWIPVTERLPEEDVRVIVRIDGAIWNTTIELDADRRHNGDWVRWGRAVTHWREMPEPPKEDTV